MLSKDDGSIDASVMAHLAKQIAELKTERGASDTGHLRRRRRRPSTPHAKERHRYGGGKQVFAAVGQIKLP